MSLQWTETLLPHVFMAHEGGVTYIRRVCNDHPWVVDHRRRGWYAPVSQMLDPEQRRHSTLNVWPPSVTYEGPPRTPEDALVGAKYFKRDRFHPNTWMSTGEDGWTVRLKLHIRHPLFEEVK